MVDLQTEIIALADYASLSKENKLTIAGIFDRIFVTKLPTKWPKMFLVLVLKGNPKSQHKVGLIIESETGKETVLDKKFDVKLGDNGKANLITGLIDFPLKHPGKYRISVKEEKNEVGYFVFSVFRVEKRDAKKSKVLQN